MHLTKPLNIQIVPSWSSPWRCTYMQGPLLGCRLTTNPWLPNNLCVSHGHYQRSGSLAYNLSRFLSWSADLRFNHLFHWINDIPASLDPPISAFYSLRLMTYFRSLTCTFLNVKVFVNEFTTCERPGALLDVLHRDLCHPWKSEQASLGLHSAFHRA